MFTAPDRQRVSDRLIARAEADPRIVAAAVVGSLAHGPGDAWSDIDLALGVAEEVPLPVVMAEWTQQLAQEFAALQLLDLRARGAIYRVFLLPSGLQIDLSFWPATDLQQVSPRFRLVFGTHTTGTPRPPDPRDLLGWAVLYALSARTCIRRARYWQAAHCIAALREKTMALACVRLKLPAEFGKGLDDLPPEILRASREALVAAPEPAELERALHAAVVSLVRESQQVGEFGRQVQAHLERLL
jgi:hypothetical protein